MLAESLVAAEASHVGKHWQEFVSTFALSMGGWSAVAYGVDSFPNPQNKYGLWAINLLRAILNKRVSGSAALDLATRVANQTQAEVTVKAVPGADPPKGL